FRNVRDAAAEQLEQLQQPYDEVTQKPLRSLEEAVADFDHLKETIEKFGSLKAIALKAKEISEQLEPLEIAYSEVRFLDVDLEQTQQQYDDVLTSIDSEVSDEKSMNKSGEQLLDELEKMKRMLEAEPNKTQLDEISRHLLPPLKAQMDVLKSNDEHAKASRIHVVRDGRPSIDQIICIANEVQEGTARKLKQMEEVEKAEHVAALRSDFEKLRLTADESEEEALRGRIEAELRLLAPDEECTKQLSEELSTIQSAKDAEKALKKEVAERLAGVKKRGDELQSEVDDVLDVGPEKAIEKRGEHIAVLDAHLNEIIGSLLPTLDDIRKECELNDVLPPSAINDELQRMSALRDKCEDEIASRKRDEKKAIEAEKKLNEAQSVFDDAEPLLSEVDEVRRTSGDPSEVENQLKIVDNVEQSVLATLTSLDAVDTSKLSESQRAEHAQKRDNLQALLNRLRALRESVDDHMKKLLRWNENKKVVDDEMNDLVNAAKQLIDRYNVAQPLSVATSDIHKAEELLERLKWVGERAATAKESLLGELPECGSVIDDATRRSEKIETALVELQNLLVPLCEDVAAENELVNKQNELLDKVSKLSERAAGIHALPEGGLAPSDELAKLHDELSEVKKGVGELEQLASIPSRLVLHGETLNVGELMGQVNNLDRLLNEKEGDVAAQLELMALTSSIASEKAKLRDALEEAQNVENSGNAGELELEGAIGGLDRAREYLKTLENAYEKLNLLPDTEKQRAELLDDQSSLGESMENISSALKDRLENLKNFNEKAKSIENDLGELRERFDRMPPADSDDAIPSVERAIESAERLRGELDALAESVDELTPLVEPKRRYDRLDSEHRQMDDALKAKREDIVREQTAKNAEKLLDGALNEAEIVLKNAERESEQVEPTSGALKQLQVTLLPAIAEKMAKVDEVEMPIISENRETLEARKNSLKARAERLRDSIDAHLADVSRQEEVAGKVHEKLNEMDVELAALASLCEHAQPLESAIESTNRLRALYDALPLVEMDDITLRVCKEPLVRQSDALKSSVKALLVPLEREVNKERELNDEVKNTMSVLASAANEVIAIDETSGTAEEIDKAASLSEYLRMLASNIESLEKKLSTQPTLVERSPMDESPTKRFGDLQEKLERKKQHLQDRAKLQSSKAEMDILAEKIRSRCDELEAVPLVSLDDQKVALQDLEAKKRELETIVESIPEGEEGDALREQSSWQLGRLSSLLASLAEAVGSKVAALASFRATKDDIEKQLVALRKPTEVHLDEDESVQGLNERLDGLKDGLNNAHRLRKKLEESDDVALDDESRNAKEVLLKEIDETVANIEAFIGNTTKLLADKIAAEKLQSETKQVLDELNMLVDEGRSLLKDSDAIPSMYETTANAFNEPLGHARDVLASAANVQDPQMVQLQTVIEQAENVREDLLKRADLWREFRNVRDAAAEQLEQLQQPYDEVTQKPLRSLEEAVADFDHLKVVLSSHQDLLLSIGFMRSLCDELSPLSVASNDLAYLSSDFDGLHRKTEDLLDCLCAEVNVAQRLMHSLREVEFECNEVAHSVHVEDISSSALFDLRQRVNDLKSHVDLVDEDIRKFNENRRFIMLSGEADVPVLARRLEGLDNIIIAVAATTGEEEYDIDEAANLLAVAYPGQDPRNVLQEQGIPFDEEVSGEECASENYDDLDAVELVSVEEELSFSPIPDDPAPARIHYQRQRSLWRRILRTALPLQAMLILLLGAACLVPHCDDEYCCQLLNNFARSFDPSLEFVNGPPPL
ncbi:hypothetical protein AB6A40_002699, partial [Gnathostoma spinigerum]